MSISYPYSTDAIISLYAWVPASLTRFQCSNWVKAAETRSMYICRFFWIQNSA